jgi:hypothetical protein
MERRSLVLAAAMGVVEVIDTNQSGADRITCLATLALALSDVSDELIAEVPAWVNR